MTVISRPGDLFRGGLISHGSHLADQPVTGGAGLAGFRNTFRVRVLNVLHIINGILSKTGIIICQNSLSGCQKQEQEKD